MGKHWEVDEEKRANALAALRYCEIPPEVIEQAKKDQYATKVVYDDPSSMGKHRIPDDEKREVANAILNNVFYKQNQNQR